MILFIEKVAFDSHSLIEHDHGDGHHHHHHQEQKRSKIELDDRKEKSEKCKENGKLRIEGKDYIVKDGDVLYFRVNP